MWYYEDNGKAVGPVTEDHLLQLLDAGTLEPRVRVWRKEFGQAWQALNATELAGRVMPPPLLKDTAEVRGVSREGPWSSADPQHSPAGLVQIIAASPLLLLALDLSLELASIYPPQGFYDFLTLAITPALLILAYYDARSVSNAGLNPDGKWIVPFMLLLPVIYLWRRAYVIGTGWRYIWIWLGSFLLLLAYLAGIEYLNSNFSS